MIYKICNLCKKTKLLCEFSKDNHMIDHHMYTCRICNREKTKKWQKENLDKRNLSVRSRYHSNIEFREKKKIADKIANKKRYYANLEEARKSQVNYRKANPDKAKMYSAKNREKNYHKILSYNAARRASKLSATPPWLSDIHKAQLQWFYASAKMMSETSGTKHHVDHIHPLQGDGFNGLHVPWNLRIIKAAENISKGNKLPIEENHLSWDSP